MSAPPGRGRSRLIGLALAVGVLAIIWTLRSCSDQRRASPPAPDVSMPSSI